MMLLPDVVCLIVPATEVVCPHGILAVAIETL